VVTKDTIRYWPDSLKQPLLRAAFLSGAAGRSAWDTWKSQVNFDDYADPGSFRLLPQLYRNLQNQGVDEPLMLRLKGVARQSWLRNKRAFSHVAPYLQTLKQAGVDLLILGEAALALRYPDYILDAKPAFSLLVQPDQAVTAMKQLGASGWEPSHRSPEVLLKAYIVHKDMQSFQGPHNQRLHLFWRCLPDNLDGGLWTEAETLELHNIEVSVLSPTDQIVYTCAPGRRGPVSRPLFWRVIDVMLILQAAQDRIDWERLISQAQQDQIRPDITDILNYIQDNLDAPMPRDLLARLNSSRGFALCQTESSAERVRMMFLPRLTSLWSNYLEETGQLSVAQRIYYFPQYLQYVWQLECLRQVPIKALSMTLQHLR
jgi:hypothetical protein